MPTAALPTATITLLQYYTASALLEARHVDQCGDLQLDTYEAVVLVFDTEAQPSFAAVQRWYETAGGADVDLGVKLAVGLLAGGSGVSGSGGARPRWLQAAEEWCKEQLVELVEAGAAEEEGEVAAAAAAAASSREGGASGWRRVREALEAHMWPGMQLKPNPRHGAASAAAEISSVEPAGAPQLEQQAIRAADVEDAVPPGNGVHASGGSSPDSLSFAELLGASGQAAAASAAADRGEEEVEVDEMEQLFAQVASECVGAAAYVQAAFVQQVADACLAAWLGGGPCACVEPPTQLMHC